jgi:hypothetical protein
MEKPCGFGAISVKCGYLSMLQRNAAGFPAAFA